MGNNSNVIIKETIRPVIMMSWPSQLKHGGTKKKHQDIIAEFNVLFLLSVLEVGGGFQCKMMFYL